MIEMVERVARALAKFEGLNWNEKWELEVYEVYRREARAAIEAMREPTEAMIRRGVVTVHSANPSCVEIWEDMIDAALE